MNRENLDSYRLSADDNEGRLRERIIPTYLAGKPARDNPIAAVIVARPGAGKTRAGSVIGDSLGGAAGYVPVDSDLYKPSTPTTPACCTPNDRLMAATALGAKPLTSCLGPRPHCHLADAQQYDAATIIV